MIELESEVNDLLVDRWMPPHYDEDLFVSSQESDTDGR